MKNNATKGVLLSPNEYIRLMDEVNDLRILAIATEHCNHESVIAVGDFYKEFGIIQEDLEAVGEGDLNELETPSFMTAPQLSVDTVDKPVDNNIISQDKKCY